MDCPHIPEMSYSEFGQRLRERIAGRRVPVSGSMELTFQCNLRCQHCYLDGVHDGIPGQEELSTEEWYDLLDQMVAEGTLWLLMTGGEPFVRPDFLDIYTYAKRKGFLITIFTNGTLITPEIADYLAEWPPYRIEVTLYGYTKETYECVTGVEGSHARCLQGIELLLARGLPLRLKTMVITLNRHELTAMKAYAEALGVPFRYDATLNAGIDGAEGPKALRLPVEEVVRLDMEDPERLSEWREFCDKFITPPPHPERLYNCGAGRTTLHIDPYGALSACLVARWPSCDLRTSSLAQGWREFIGTVIEQPRRRDTACAHCKLSALCGQCPGWAQMENGDQEEAVDYLCRLAHQRAEALGV